MEEGVTLVAHSHFLLRTPLHGHRAPRARLAHQATTPATVVPPVKLTRRRGRRRGMRKEEEEERDEEMEEEEEEREEEDERE